ncbi:MAG TPA: type II secretion system protein [Rhodocyclaceae bacterium]|nr:type II secretion system protein [Rhodocyclaceae bacterium]
MRERRGQSGFTLLELAVVIVVVSILAGIGLERLRFYQEAAEAAVVDNGISTLKTALHIRSAELISANRWEELRRLPQRNPFDLMEEKPGNYGGAWQVGAAPGYWYFDEAAQQVVYRVSRSERFLAEDGGKDIRFAAVGRNTAGQETAQAGVAYVSLRPVGIYRWFDHLLR